jgi:hypothetical protein
LSKQGATSLIFLLRPKCHHNTTIQSEHTVYTSRLRDGISVSETTFTRILIEELYGSVNRACATFVRKAHISNWAQVLSQPESYMNLGLYKRPSQSCRYLKYLHRSNYIYRQHTTLCREILHMYTLTTCTLCPTSTPSNMKNYGYPFFGAVAFDMLRNRWKYLGIVLW